MFVTRILHGGTRSRTRPEEHQTNLKSKGWHEYAAHRTPKPETPNNHSMNSPHPPGACKRRQLLKQIPASSARGAWRYREHSSNDNFNFTGNASSQKNQHSTFTHGTHLTKPRVWPASKVQRTLQRQNLTCHAWIVRTTPRRGTRRLATLGRSPSPCALPTRQKQQDVGVIIQYQGNSRSTTELPANGGTIGFS